MIKIKPLNNSESSDSSDSEYQVTREAEEEELNKLYIAALKYASNGNTDNAVKLLEELKQELEVESPKVKDVLLLNRLKYLTYKNLGLLQNDLNLILNALDIDNSDVNLWITAGRKGKENFDFLLSKYCFENAFKFNEFNYIIIDNLIDLHFILNDLYSCVNICLHSLQIDSEYAKARILINECIRIMPPLIKELREHMNYISVEYGGNDDSFENEEFLIYKNQILNSLIKIKTKRLRVEEENEHKLAIKRQKMSLNLKNGDISTFSELGIKIKNLYEQINKNNLNICTPVQFTYLDNKLVLETDKLNSNQSDILENDCSDEMLPDLNNKNSDEASKNETQPSFKEKKSKDKNISLYDYIDKRRSSRVKSKPSKNRDYIDDQSIQDSLLELLPVTLKPEYSLKSESMDKDCSSNSASMSEAELKSADKTPFEKELVDVYKNKLNQQFKTKETMNIFEIIESFLFELSTVKHITIPTVFFDLYKIYRKQNELPCGVMCEIGKDISIESIWVCLTANETKYNKNEAIFLNQILSKLSNILTTENYLQFLIRLLVLWGSKEFNNDYLYYALQLCSERSICTEELNDTKTHKNEKEQLSKECFDVDNENSSYEVLASNKLTINCQYINTLLNMQTISVDNFSKEKNHADIIKLFYTKCESELSVEEKSELCQTIIAAQIWDKGVDSLENWKEFDEECLTTILQCVYHGKRARLTPKLASKIVKHASEGKSVLPWLILYWSFIAEGADITDPGTPLIKFFKMGHHLLGKKGICTSQDGEFLLLAQKIFIEHDIENEALKCFTCLFDFPPRKQQQSTDAHSSPNIKLKWEHCNDIYNYFAPEQMPEFDARQSGLTQETKDIFFSVLRQIPEEEQPIKSCVSIRKYIFDGESFDDQHNKSDHGSSITTSLYYLLADYYFKTKDFKKAQKFYIFDLALNLNRFDSWAGLALSINYLVDQMLIEGNDSSSEKYQQTAFSAVRCFERALNLQPNNSKLWIEYGILCYNIASNLSRLKKRVEMHDNINKQFLATNLIKYDEVLNKAKHCFEKANDIDTDNDELWLSYYMLGKVLEKNNENLMATIECYEWADLCLFLDGATYPKKIAYKNLTVLSVEALEIHYRIHSCILKYLINNRKFSARMLRQIKLHLIRASKSPFVFGKTVSSSYSSQNLKKLSSSKCANYPGHSCEVDTQIVDLLNDVVSIVSERDVKFDVNVSRNLLINMCIDGIKRCLSRYNGHYKSYYRLAQYFYQIMDYPTAKSVLCGGMHNKLNQNLHFQSESFKHTNSNSGYITGLFSERKPSNLYNGIWRISVDEIERAGNFNAHMFRCTKLLINVCKITEDYDLLSTIATQLYKKPEVEKRYLNDIERKLLCRTAFDSCFNLFRNHLSNPKINKEKLFEEISRIVQNLKKNNIFIEELVKNCAALNEQVSNANRQM